MADGYTSLVEGRARARLSGIRGRFLVGFSGGADSTVLMTVMIKLFGAENVVAVHINHMLRGSDADSDEEFCRDFCEKRGVAFFSKRIDVKALCGGKAFEETARNVRYDVFTEISGKENIKYIALAHTQSDNFETVLFNIFRGSGLSGLRGIPFSRPCGNACIVRPLIDCTRQDIIGYAEECGLDFVTDKTNFDTHYTRNFIRNNVVSRIKEIFPSAERSAGNMSELVAVDYDFITSETAKFLKENSRDGRLPASALAGVHPAIRRHAVASLYGDTLPSERVKDIESALISGKDTRLAVSGGIYATISDGKFFFEKSPAKEQRPEFDMTLSPGINISPLGFAVCIGGGSCPKGYAPVGEIDVPVDILPELHARSRRAGDRYRFWKMTRTLKKMVSSFPRDVRMVRPVICAGDEVIWYPGFPCAEFGAWRERGLKIKYYEKDSEANDNDAE